MALILLGAGCVGLVAYIVLVRLIDAETKGRPRTEQSAPVASPPPGQAADMDPAGRNPSTTKPRWDGVLLGGSLGLVIGICALVALAPLFWTQMIFTAANSQAASGAKNFMHLTIVVVIAVSVGISAFFGRVYFGNWANRTKTPELPASAPPAESARPLAVQPLSDRRMALWIVGGMLGLLLSVPIDIALGVAALRLMVDGQGSQVPVYGGLMLCVTTTALCIFYGAKAMDSVGGYRG